MWDEMETVDRSHFDRSRHLCRTARLHPVPETSTANAFIGNIGNALRWRGPLGRGDREHEELPALVAYSIWKARHSIDMASDAITINRAAGIRHEPTLRL